MAKKKAKKPEKKKNSKAAVESTLAVRLPAGKEVDIYGAKDDTTEKAMKTVASTLARRKNRDTEMIRTSDLTQRIIPLDHLALQQFVQSSGLVQGTILELIGKEHTGKTTMAFTLAGMAMRYCHAAVLNLHCDAKPMAPERVMRALSTNPIEGKAFMDNLMHKNVSSLHQMWEVVEEWTKTMRGELGGKKEAVCLPINQPLVIIVDPFSRLLSPKEAAGFQLYGNYMDPKVAESGKDIGEGSNFEAAKFAQEFCRKLGYLCEHYNVMFIIISNQNTKFDMGAKMGVALPQQYIDMRNKTKRGGNALNSAAAYQWIATDAGPVKNEMGDVIGKKIWWRSDKNSYGCTNRELMVEIHEITPYDAPGFMEPALQFDRSLIDTIVNDAVLPIENHGFRFSWDAEKVYDQPLQWLMHHLTQRRDAVEKFVRRYQIKGYYDPVAEAVAAAIAAQKNVQSVNEQATLKNDE